MGPSLLLAQSLDLGIGRLITLFGAGAAVAALVGLATVLPLYLLHRAEVRRLTAWMEAEPEKGEGEGGTPVTAPLGSGAAKPTGPLTPVERVTIDRPALQRITSERAALESQSSWRRLLVAGPRHPLVLSILAVLVAGAAVFGVYFALNEGNGPLDDSAPGLDRGEVEVVVLNGSSQPALAEKVGETLEIAGFDIVGTKATGAFQETSVLFGKRSRREGKAVARELGEDEIQPMPENVRAVARGATVVVIAGEDRTGVRSGEGGG